MQHCLTMLNYWLPILLGWSLAIVMRRAAGDAFTHHGMALLLAGIGAAYSFDRLVDARSESERPMPKWIRWTLSFAAALCAITVLAASFKMPPRVLVVAGILSATSLAYTRLKRLPLVKTLAVALAWTWACATLPMAGGERLAWRWISLDVSLPVILMLAAGCFLCDLKDAVRDRRARVPSLPALIGLRATCLVATAVSLLAAWLAFSAGRFGVVVGGMLLAVAAQFPSLLERETVGPIVVDSILVIPGLLVYIGVV